MLFIAVSFVLLFVYLFVLLYNTLCLIVNLIQQFFYCYLETRIGQPGCPHFTNAEVNADYTVIKITVNDVNMSEDERILADDILLYSTVYSGLSGKDNAEARIDFNNMLGQTVRTMNNG